MTDMTLLRDIVKPRSRAANDTELALFAATCERTGLDPLARQIYAQFRRDSKTGVEHMSIQATIDGLRVVAERSGDYLGGDAPQWCGRDGDWRDVWLEESPPAASRVTVRKSVGGVAGATTVVAHWREYAPSGPAGQMWAKMPALMLAKVAEALALRRAFPMLLSGVYAAEEMTSAEPDPPSTPTPTDAYEALRLAAKGLKWSAIKDSYVVAGLAAPALAKDAFTALDDEQALALRDALLNRKVADTTDVPYPAAEVGASTAAGDSDLPWGSAGSAPTEAGGDGQPTAGPAAVPPPSTEVVDAEVVEPTSDESFARLLAESFGGTEEKT